MNNILLITIDSLRADHSPTNGYNKETLKFSDSLGGSTFLNAYSNAPYTPGSIPSMLSGQYPLKDGHVATIDRPIIPEYLSDTDYTTGAIYSNIQIPLYTPIEEFDEEINLTGVYMTDSGNESYSENSETILDQIRKDTWNLINGISPVSETIRSLYYRYKYLRQDLNYKYNIVEQPHPTGEEIVNRAIEWVSKVQEPYFLWLHFMDSHHPYYFKKQDFQAMSDYEFDPNYYSRLYNRAMTHVEPPQDFIWNLDESQRQYLIDAYDASLRYTDRLIKKLLEDVGDQTTTIITSDHGEELWDHGNFGHSARDSKPRPPKLYQEMIHVPLIINGPDVENTEITTPVSLIDILPTILDVSGASDMGDLPGKSIIDINDEKDEERPIIAQATSPGDPNDYINSSQSRFISSIIKNNYKLIHYSKNRDELYNILKDSNEKNNIIDDNQKLAERLKSIVSETIDPIDNNKNKIREMTPGMEDKLKDLGYL